MADDGSNGNMDTSGSQNDDDRKLFAGGLAQEATEKDIKDNEQKGCKTACRWLKQEM